MIEPPLEVNIEDPQSLFAYLRSRGWNGGNSPSTFRLLAGGVSNRTVLVEDSQRRGLVIKQALEKLRVPDEWICSPDRIRREALGLMVLQQVQPPGTVPALVFEDRPYHILAMEAVPEPHKNWRTLLLEGVIQRPLFQQWGRLLGNIQAMTAMSTTPVDAAALQELSDTAFFNELRIEPYYLSTAQRMPEAAGFLRNLVDQTRQRHEVVVHGDFSPKNLLVQGGRLRLLDFEVIHLGDAGFDLGFSLTHLLAKLIHDPQNQNLLKEGIDEYLSAFRQTAGHAFTPEHAGSAVAHTIGCLLARVAGKSQLDYLNSDEKHIQRTIALYLLNSKPETPEDLLEGFVSELADMRNR